MIAKVICGLFGLALSASVASAQCTVPNTLTNGTNADANQVMANFNAILTCINGGGQALQGFIGGLTLSNNVTTPNTVLNTASGAATSDDNATSIRLTSAITKAVNASWAVGSGNGCLDAGSLAASTWYHVFLILRPDSGVVDELCSASATAPTMPNAAYTRKRRIGSFKTNASSQILAFTQFGDQFIWATPVRDAANVAVGTSVVTQTLASVPSGVRVNAQFRVYFVNPAGWVGLLFPVDDGSTSIATPTGNFNMNGAAGVSQSGQYDLLTNTSQQVKVLMNAAAGTANMVTYGWVDSRGRFN